jgi:hypothetical protein
MNIQLPEAGCAGSASLPAVREMAGEAHLPATLTAMGWIDPSVVVNVMLKSTARRRRSENPDTLIVAEPADMTREPTDATPSATET